MQNPATRASFYGGPADGSWASVPLMFRQVWVTPFGAVWSEARDGCDRYVRIAPDRFVHENLLAVRWAV